MEELCPVPITAEVALNRMKYCGRMMRMVRIEMRCPRCEFNLFGENDDENFRNCSDADADL
jgi:hypothetical protein